MHIGQLVGGLDIYIRNSLTYMPQGSLKFIIVHGKCDNNEPIRRGDELLKEYSVNPVSYTHLTLPTKLEV